MRQLAKGRCHYQDRRRKILDSNTFQTILGAKGGSSIDLLILRFGVRRTVKVKNGAGRGRTGGGGHCDQTADGIYLAWR